MDCTEKEGDGRLSARYDGFTVVSEGNGVSTIVPDPEPEKAPEPEKGLFARLLERWRGPGVRPWAGVVDAGDPGGHYRKDPSWDGGGSDPAPAAGIRIGF